MFIFSDYKLGNFILLASLLSGLKFIWHFFEGALSTPAPFLALWSDSHYSLWSCFHFSHCQKLLLLLPSWIYFFSGTAKFRLIFVLNCSRTPLSHMPPMGTGCQIDISLPCITRTICIYPPVHCSFLPTCRIKSQLYIPHHTRTCNCNWRYQENAKS